MVVFNTPVAFEVAQTSIAVEAPAGIFLTYDANGLLTFSTAGSSRFDAILISTILNQTDYQNQYFIFNEVDYGPYVLIGSPVSVAKANKVTANMLTVLAPGAIAAGSALEIGANGALQLHAAGSIVAYALDPIASGATVTGAIHIMSL
jgi:hypothetical protein